MTTPELAGAGGETIPMDAAVIGVDVGGSNARVAVVEGAAVVRDVQLLTGRERPFRAVCDDIGEAIRALDAATPGGIAAVGLGVAGQIDLASGAVRFAPNLDWHDVPLRAQLQQALRVPVMVLNDVQAAAYGEWSFGAARGHDSAVAMFVGTGLGGGIICDGRLVRGCDGAAGELGHLPIQLDGPDCRCGGRGCLEAHAGGWAIARRAYDAAVADPARASALLALAGDLGGISAETVAAAAESGDPLALEVVHETALALGTGMAAVLNAFNPCVLVLGGSVALGTPGLAEGAEAVARARALPAVTRSVRFARAALGDHAGTIGAAAWARRHLAPG